MDAIESKHSKPLITVFIVMIVLFSLFAGGAIIVTIENGGLMGTGWGSGISWMWIPALLFLTLAIIISYVLTKMKNEQQ